MNRICNSCKNFLRGLDEIHGICMKDNENYTCTSECPYPDESSPDIK